MVATMDMLNCTKCDEVKPLGEFSRDASMKRGYKSWCKACTKAAHLKWRASTEGAERLYRARQDRLAATREWLWGLKSNPCADCGNTYHPVAMQFDHLPGFEKKFNVNMEASSRTRAALDAELAKCELVCANCHAIRTWTRRIGG